MTWQSCAQPQRAQLRAFNFWPAKFWCERREKSSRTGNKAQRDLFGARAFAAAGRKVGEFGAGGSRCEAAAESGANGHTTLEV